MASGDAFGMQDDVSARVDTEPVSMRPALPILDDASRSPDPNVCPFFRRQAADGRLFAPLGSPDAENVCAAIGIPRGQSERQQELVCLRAAHADCPRYLRGALTLPDPPKRHRPATFPRATVAALLVLVLSAGISFGYVVQRGGIAAPVVAGGPASTAVAVATTPEPTTAPTIAAASIAAESAAPATPPPTPDPTARPTPSPSPSPSPTPSPTPTPTPKPTPKPTKQPTSDRYKLLDPCPDKDGCWIYTVRSGDNLFSIAKYFGHSLKTIYTWNPQYPETALKVGAKIRMPPPTR